ARARAASSASLPGPAPASAHAPGPTPPLPSADGTMSTRAKMSLADAAFHLRDEQLRARVVHYKAELETSPELDAVTAQVVAELQAMQRAANVVPGAPSPPRGGDRAQIEIELIATLKRLLARLFRAGQLSAVVEHKMAEASKRFARLFFESELCERIRGTTGEQKTMRFASQALYHVLTRNAAFLHRQLDAFEYASPSDKDDARARLDDITKELRNEFLSSTTPELNALVKYLNEVLAQFFTVELPPAIGELAWEVVKEARLADPQGPSGPSMIGADAFPRFRTTFERKFLQRLVAHVEDGMLERVRAKESDFRAETLRFIADPQIFSDVCELVCDAVYDCLRDDGFLDLPAHWR
ncbi:MAG TPA: hypothetical protein VKU41_10445, partial [Polyangiaceae bacterium]|nr:hypothetical protein [Polyangiaceae bacterium]